MKRDHQRDTYQDNRSSENKIVCCRLSPVIPCSLRCRTNGRKQRYWKTAASHFPFLWTFIMKLTPWSFNESNNLPLPFSFQAVEIMPLTLNQFEMRNKNKRRVSFNLFYAGFERRSHAFKWGHPVDTWQQEYWGDWSWVTAAVIHWLTVWARSHQLWTMSTHPLIYRPAISPPLPCCLTQHPPLCILFLSSVWAGPVGWWTAI